MALTAISLFSGAGGMDHGVRRGGFDVVLSTDFDPDCCRTLRAVPGGGQVLEIGSADLFLSSRRGKVDLLFAGVPCQPYSRAGRWSAGDVKRTADPRADTLRHFLRIVEEVRPRAVLFENVDDFAVDGEDSGLRYLQAGLALVDGVAGTSYAKSGAHATLNASDYGVPQHRKRFFLVAFEDGRPFSFPATTHADQPRTVWDALGDLPVDGSPEIDLDPRGKWADLLPCMPEGTNYQWFSRKGKGPRLFGVGTRYWNFLLKLDRGAPSCTVTASPGPGIGPFHWTGRRLSVRELMRLQTFPDEVVIVGDSRSARRQVGNAVPSHLAEVLAAAIAEQGFSVSVRGGDRGTGSLGRGTLVPPDRGQPPPWKPTARVPKRFKDMATDPEKHPGIGKGPGARRRAEEGTQ